MIMSRLLVQINSFITTVMVLYVGLTCIEVLYSTTWQEKNKLSIMVREWVDKNGWQKFEDNEKTRDQFEWAHKSMLTKLKIVLGKIIRDDMYTVASYVSGDVLVSSHFITLLLTFFGALGFLFQLV